ncbi:pyridoxal phosphate-dependent transferase [Trichoderma barbatum]
MAPSGTQNFQSPKVHLIDCQVGTPSPLSTEPEQDSLFTIFRRLVPLVSNGKITHLNAGFMPPCNLVVEDAISRFCSEALHHESPKSLWKQDAEQLRDLLGRYLQTEPSSLAFVRDTTEGLGSFMHGLRFEEGDNVVILDCEHPNQMYGWLSLRAKGLEVRLVPTVATNAKIGRIEAANANTFAPYVDSKTKAIGLSSVMFHSGQRNDVADVCAIFRPRGIHILADLTQEVGFADVNIASLGVSAASFSMHKGLNTPTGIAVLYMDPEVVTDLDPVPPLVGYGGIANISEDTPPAQGPIEFHPTVRRYEHANMGWINVVCGRAFMEFYLDVMGPKNVEDHLYAIGDHLRRACAMLGIEITGPRGRKQHSPHLYVLQLHDVRWYGHMREAGVIVTKLATGIRVSFGFYNNMTDVDGLVDVIRSGVAQGIPLA